MEYKRCYWCGKLFPPQELSKRGNCLDCAFERMKRWNDLVREAHRQFMDDEIERAKKRIEDSELDKLYGKEK